MKVFFLDTNVFIQCLPISDLPWDEIADGHDLRLAIPRTVQEEIDRFKQDGNSRRARRARAASAQIREVVLAPGNTKEVRTEKPRVEISFVPVPRDKHTCPESLDLSRGDDAIIWEMLTYKEEHPNESIALLTHDTNPMLTAKRHNLEFVVVPDVWLLPPEPDDRDKKISEIERRLKYHQDLAPRIVVSVNDQQEAPAEVLEIFVKTYDALSADQIEGLVTAMKERYPLMTDSRSNIPVASFMPSNLGYKWQPPSRNDIESYRQAYSGWEDKLREFFKQYSSRLEDPSRRARLILVLENQGSVPAANLIVEFRACGGILLQPPRSEEGERRPKDFILPDPPKPPQGQWVAPWASMFAATQEVERTIRGLVSPTVATPFSRYRAEEFFIPPIRTTPPRDRNCFYWKNGKPKQFTDTWALECEEFRHQVHSESFEIWIYAPSDQLTEKGSILCIVTATNLPEPTRKIIPVAIHRAVGNAESEALRLIRQ